MSYSVARRLGQLKLCGMACDRRIALPRQPSESILAAGRGCTSTTLSCEEAGYGLLAVRANHGPHPPNRQEEEATRRRNPRYLGATFHICRSVLFRNGTAQRSSARMFPRENPPKHYVDRPPTPTTARFINPHIDNIKSKHPGRSPSAIEAFSDPGWLDQYIHHP
jgi:hypothetical protein